MVQFLAFAGALLFNVISNRVGTKQAIVLSLLIWSGVIARYTSRCEPRSSSSSWLRPSPSCSVELRR